MRSLLRAFVLAASVPAICAAGPAQEPIAVPLATIRLPDPGMVLSPSCVNRASRERPIVYYCNYGTEVILPGRRLSFLPDRPRQAREIGQVPCAFLQDGEGIALDAGGRHVELRPAGLGFAPVEMLLAGGRSCVLAFPRGFFHDGTATLFCRSGSARVGPIGQERISLYDDNLDGQYTQGADGVCIGDPGNIAIFAPLGQLIPTGQGVYQIEQVAPDGSMLKLAPFPGKTGRIRMEMAAEDLQCRLAFASEDGKCSFAMMAGPQPVALPVGVYRLLHGLVYRPASGRAAALILPDERATVKVEADAEVPLALGQVLLRNDAASDRVLNLPFEALLEIDLTAVERACEAGGFDKAQSEFSRILAKHKAGPNRAATRQWIDELRERLELESTPQAAELRRAEENVLSAVKRGDRGQAKDLLTQVRAAAGNIPARLTGLRVFRLHKARAEALARYAEGSSAPGLKATYFSWGFRQVTGTEVVPAVDWAGSPGGGRTRFYGCRYEGFLVAPEEGEYELSLESDEGARLHLDGKQVIEHWGAHTLAEKAVRVRLTAGPHPLRIEYYQALGGAALHFRWTPPGGRKMALPAWALEHGTSEAPPRAPEQGRLRGDPARRNAS